MKRTLDPRPDNKHHLFIRTNEPFIRDHDTIRHIYIQMRPDSDEGLFDQVDIELRKLNKRTLIGSADAINNIAGRIVAYIAVFFVYFVTFQIMAVVDLMKSASYDEAINNLCNQQERDWNTYQNESKRKAITKRNKIIAGIATATLLVGSLVAYKKFVL